MTLPFVDYKINANCSKFVKIHPKNNIFRKNVTIMGNFFASIHCDGRNMKMRQNDNCRTALKR